MEIRIVVVEKLRCGIHVNLRASSLIDNLKTLVATAIKALPVLPGVIITDRGLVDGLSQQFIEQFEG